MTGAITGVPTNSNEAVLVTCSPNVQPSGVSPSQGERGTFARLFSKRKRVPRLADGCEVDTRARPFKTSVVEPYIDLADCTYGVIEDGSKVAQGILKFGKEIFTDSAFQVKETNRVDCDSDCSDDEDAQKEIGTSEKKEQFGTELHLPCGIHEGTFNGRRVVVLIQREGKPEGAGYSVQVRRSLCVFTEGRGNEHFLQQFCEHFLKKLDPKPKEQHFHIYRWDHCRQYWRQTSYEKARVMKSVILPQGMRESVEEDVGRFLSKKTRAWYQKRGIPYKRCYMFFGVPGTGKTSLITALAGRFRRKVCFLSPHHPKFTDEKLKTCLSKVPSKAIVVLEDIDSLFKKDRQSNNDKSPLTFTGLLNGLDGIGEHTGTVFIMTTNFIDRLDSALIRAGRVDMKVEFKHADDYQLGAMFRWFYDETPEIADKLADSFVALVRKKFPAGITMAELQQHFIDNMFNDAQTCLDNLKHYDLPLLQKLFLTKPKQDDEPKKSKKDEKKGGLAKPAMVRSSSR